MVPVGFSTWGNKGKKEGKKVLGLIQLTPSLKLSYWSCRNSNGKPHHLLRENFLPQRRLFQEVLGTENQVLLKDLPCPALLYSR